MRSPLHPVRVSRIASGFTLIELLVVISIISLLVALLLPVLGKARASGQMALCLSNVRQGVGTFAMYASDNNGYFPAMGAAGHPLATDTLLGQPAAWSKGVWGGFLGITARGGYMDLRVNRMPWGVPVISGVSAPYTGLFSCPSMATVSYFGTISGVGIPSSTPTNNPNPFPITGPLAIENIGSNFGLNWDLWRNTYGVAVMNFASSFPNDRQFYPIMVDRMPRPAATYLMGDRAYGGINGSSNILRRSTLTTINTNETVDFRHGGPVLYTDNNATSVPVTNANGTANMAYFDGHVNSESNIQVSRFTSTNIRWTGGF